MYFEKLAGTEVFIWSKKLQCYELSRKNQEKILYLWGSGETE